jgi:hypothetical protein
MLTGAPDFCPTRADHVFLALMLGMRGITDILSVLEGQNSIRAARPDNAA